MENQENQWYVCPGDEGQRATAAYAQVKKRKKKFPVWAIVLIVLAAAALVVISCSVFRSPAAAESESAVPGTDSDGELPDDYKSFFDNYFSSYEEAEECTIPQVKADRNVTVELLPFTGELLSDEEIYEKCAPSIVAITAYPDADSTDSYYWGSGVVLTEDGYILTNSHVIEGTCSATVTLWNDEEYEAKLIGYDTRTDLAVLKIAASGLTAAEFGTSDTLRVGDSVVAIGNPLGKEFRSTMTEGIISGIDRAVTSNGVTQTLLQTSAPINEGNSGGALINSLGQVIGITNMKMSNQYAGSVSIEGIGFAIPSSTVKEVTESLVQNGEVVGRPALGLTVGKVPQTAMDEYGLPSGLYVSAVSEGSDCAKKGIEAGDVLLAVNGSELTSNEDLTDVIAELGVGDELTLTVWHDGETKDVTVCLVDVNDVY